MNIRGLFATFAMLACACTTIAATSHANQLNRLPIRFEPTRMEGIFEARGLTYKMALSASECLLDLKSSGTLRMRLQNANKAAEVVKGAPLPGTVTYLRNADFRPSVPGYKRLTWKEVLPGIDVAYYGANGQLEFDYIVTPRAEPSAIRVQYQGQKQLSIDSEGNLMIDTGAATLVQKAPAVYQRLKDSSLRLVAAGYELRGDGVVGYRVSSYDKSLPLIIDPVLVYSQYLGGSASEGGGFVARDSRGRLYVAGTTSSTDFSATDGTLQLIPGGLSDAFLTVYDPASNQQVYSTFFGGSGADRVTGLAIDAGGRAFLTGGTSSTNFPVSQFPAQGVRSGDTDAFFTVIDPARAGSEALVYSTYLGGSGNDQGSAIAVRADGTAAVAGYTDSTNFPLQGTSAQGANAGARDGFLAVFDIFQTFSYATYLGGGRTDYARAVAFAGDGSILVAGTTLSGDFPTTGTPRQTEANGGGEAFVSRYSPSGTLTYSTYFGDGGLEEATAIAAGPGNRIWFAGFTTSNNLPLVGPSISQRDGATDIFVAGLDTSVPPGQQLYFATLIGGNESEVPYSLTANAAGQLVVAGYTTSLNFPVAGGPIQASFGGGSTDAFLLGIDSAQTGTAALTYSTYLGGAGTDIAFSGLGEANGRYLVSGSSTSRRVPATNSADSPNSPGAGDGFVLVVAP
ncbi:MAG: hypothetical protein H7039_03520 [Bryobacteraceae bacterium]|nr:hypothetical protein [Bryobacteraceae bacterium]